MFKSLHLVALALALAAVGAAGHSAAAGASEQPLASVTSAAGHHGQQVTIALQGDSGAQTFGAFDLKIVFDPSVVTALDCASDIGICNPDFDASAVRAAGISIGGWSGHVEFARITFGLAGPPGSRTPLDLQVINLANADVEDIAPETSVVDGQIQVLFDGEPTPSPSPPPPVTQGDAQCDGDVDPVDALAILSAVAGGDPPDCAEAADVNCDGQLSAVDALWVLRYVAGLPLNPPDHCAPIGS